MIIKTRSYLAMTRGKTFHSHNVSGCNKKIHSSGRSGFSFTDLEKGHQVRPAVRRMALKPRCSWFADESWGPRLVRCLSWRQCWGVRFERTGSSCSDRGWISASLDLSAWWPHRAAWWWWWCWEPAPTPPHPLALEHETAGQWKSTITHTHTHSDSLNQAQRHGLDLNTNSEEW